MPSGLLCVMYAWNYAKYYYYTHQVNCTDLHVWCTSELILARCFYWSMFGYVSISYCAQWVSASEHQASSGCSLLPGLHCTAEGCGTLYQLSLSDPVSFSCGREEACSDITMYEWLGKLLKTGQLYSITIVVLCILCVCMHVCVCMHTNLLFNLVPVSRLTVASLVVGVELPPTVFLNKVHKWQWHWLPHVTEILQRQTVNAEIHCASHFAPLPWFISSG